MNDYEIILLALVAWREARSEGPIGMAAVMHVIANRVKQGWGGWIKVITAASQFASMTVKGDSQTVAWPQTGDKVFEVALAEASIVHSGEHADQTAGALYYANLKTATSGWFFTNIANNPEDHPQTAVIGKHTFFA